MSIWPISSFLEGFQVFVAAFYKRSQGWGDGQNTEPQSMDYPNELPKWTTFKWTTPKNTVSDEYYIKRLRFYTYAARTCIFFVPHGLQPPF